MGGKKHGTPPAEGNAILPLAPKLDPPKITSPTQVPYYSNTTDVTISGTCTVGPGATVYLGGDEDQKVVCNEDGTFSFSVNKASDGMYNYRLIAKSLTLHPSDETAMSWTRSTTPPEPPTITSPAFFPHATSSNSMTLSGQCLTDGNVYLSGDATDSISCSADGQFSFTINKSTDAIYDFELTQTDKFGNTSSAIAVSWKRDTAVPNSPTRTQPATSPYHSADDAINISGTCVIGTSVVMTGSDNDEIFCSDGNYSFTVTHTIDATYSYTLKSKSSTGILSTASASFIWQREAALPSTPVIISPPGGVLASNTSTGTISGTCTDTDIVYLTGDGTDNQTCSGSSFSFLIAQSGTLDHTYTYSIYQKNALNAQSGATTVTWLRDVTVPINPIMTVPGITPYYASTGPLLIAGVCEAGARVELGGDITSSVNCSGTNFSFSIPVNTQGTYNLTLSQIDGVGNDSKSVFAATTLTWILDSTAPAAPTVTQPATQPLYTNTNNLNIAGACETNATVNLSENVSGNLTSLNSATCTAGTYSFNINKSSENTFNFVIKQTDRAGNTSPTVSVNWTRDVTAPAAPSLISPAQNPYTSSDTNLNVTLSCEVNSTVSWSGASTGSALCTSGNINWSISQSTDGTYNVSFMQTDKASNASPALNFQWSRVSTIPNTPNVSSPATNPFYSNQLSLNISGTCDTGNTVSISGDMASSTTCASGVYNFSLSNSADGTYNYSIIQTSPSNVASSAASFRWIIDRQVPSAINMTSPTLNPYISASSNVTFQGNCENLATVVMSGASSSSVVCSGGLFSFNVSKSTDGIYDFSFAQTDLAGNSSLTVLKSWRRDTQNPLPPTITQPNVSPNVNPTDPFVSGDSSLIIAGACEKDATVVLTGDSSQSMICPADNKYSFIFNDSSLNSLNTYDFYLTQIDLAGNTSSPTNHLVWIHDTTVPAVPSLTPMEGDYYSSTATLTVYVTCDSSSSPNKNIVHLNSSTITGSEIINSTAGAGLTDLDCNSSPVFFTIQKSTDGNYSMSFSQENPNNTSSSNTSAETTLIWHLDRIAPTPPAINSPATNPYTAPGNITLAGTCETDSTVNVSISETLTTNISTLNAICTNNAFSFDIIKSDDDTYTFTLNQTDRAGNTSLTTTQVWVRNSNSLPVPTIDTPTNAGAYVSNGSSLTLSGSCISGYTVTLGGAGAIANDVSTPYHSLTQSCTTSNNYSFTVGKSSDGTYEFTVYQSYNGFDSGSSALSWTRDTTGPITTITVNTVLSSGNTVNLNPSMDFTLTTNDPGTVTYSCKLDNDPDYITPCSSNLNYGSVTNGNRTLSVFASDELGNVGPVQTKSWTQASYKTVALYHLNSLNANPINDSGPFTSNTSINNNLTAYGTPITAGTGKFNSAYQMTTTTTVNNYFFTNNNDAIQTLNQYMTVEGFVKIATQPSSNNKYFTLVSKSAAGSLGWEVLLNRSSSNCYKIQFKGSLNGSSSSTKSASSCKTLNVGTWYYFAVTWNKGSVRLYLNGTSSVGSGTIGTAGSSVLFSSTAALKLGSGSNTSTVSGSSSIPLTGSLDEVRISNVVRTITIPTAEFTSPD